MKRALKLGNVETSRNCSRTYKKSAKCVSFHSLSYIFLFSGYLQLGPLTSFTSKLTSRNNEYLSVVRTIAKSGYQFRHVCMSVCPHGTTRFPSDVFSWNLIFECFSKICREKFEFRWNRTGMTRTYRKANTYIWSYLAHFFLEWEMFPTNAVEKVKTQISYSITLFFPPKNVPFMR